MTHATADWIASIAILVPVFLVSLTIHEFAHAITATLLGDITPSKDGRITLNPLAHIDYVGLLLLIVLRFGWAKPVRFNPNNFSFPKTFSVLTALAGPLSNILLALMSMYLLKIVAMIAMPLAAMKTCVQILQAMVSVNVMLSVLNILPIPPLDGGHLLMVFLREQSPEWALALDRYSLFILIALLVIFPFGSEFLHGLYKITAIWLTSLVII